MKTKLLTALVCSLPFTFAAQAQIKKESILLGGQISYYNSTVDYSTNQLNQKNKTAAFNVSIGRAVKENNIYGVNLTYSPTRSENFFNGANYVTTKGNQYNLGVFNRRYKNLAKDFYFFAEFGAAYIYNKQTNADAAGTIYETLKQSGGQAVLTPGLSYKILNKLHLEILIPNIVTLQYAVTKNETPTNQSKQTQFLVNSSLNSTGGGLTFLGVGFHFIL